MSENKEKPSLVANAASTSEPIKKSVSRSEYKRSKFVELAEKRVENALKAISLIRNLANTHNYEYTDRDVSKICKALETEVRDVRRAFEVSAGGKERFRLEK